MSIRISTLGGLLCVAAALSTTLSPARGQTEPGAVVFSELMWSGSDASSADEWIELYNRGAEPVDLSGWTITRGEDEDEAVMVLIPVAVIMPGEVFLIANYKADDDRSRLAWAPDLVDAAVSLPDSRLRLRLYDADPSVGRVVDEADDGRGAPFAGLGGDSKASMVRVSLDRTGSLPESWSTAEEAAGWDSGAVELGTPGSIPGQLQPDATSATQVTAASWGRLKAGRR